MHLFIPILVRSTKPEPEPVFELVISTALHVPSTARELVGAPLLLVPFNRLLQPH
jgi:hypothetical protein